MSIRIPGKVLESVRVAQAERNLQLGEYAFTDTQLVAADNALEFICKTHEAWDYMVKPMEAHPFVSRALVFTWGWYADQIDFGDTPKPLLHAQSAKVVQFREAFIRNALGQDTATIISSLCDVSPLVEYAQNGCTGDAAFRKCIFLHGSMSTKLVGQQAYNSIDRQKWALIIYPMYEAVLLSAIAMIIAYEYQRWRERKEKAQLERELSLIREQLQANAENYNRQESELARARQQIQQILIEMEIRTAFLIDQIEEPLGCVSREELVRIYLETYLPALKAVREGNLDADSEEFRTCKDNANWHLKRILPQCCNTMLEDGRRCERLVPFGTKRCPEHE